MKSTYFLKALLCVAGFGISIGASGENPDKNTYIANHWNYPPNSMQTVYVVSEGDDVELFINGIPFGHGKRDLDHLYRFDNVIFQPGILTAVSYDWNGKELGRHTVTTAGVPAILKLSVTENPEGFRANGTDIALLQFEVTDFQGRRCGSDDREVSFEIEGPAEWLGSLPEEEGSVYSKKISAEHGTNRALVRSTTTPGEIRITARAKGLEPASLTLNSTPVMVID